MTTRRPPKRAPASAARIEADPQAPLVLALDASGPVEALALAQGAIVLASSAQRRARGRGTPLALRIRDLLAGADRPASSLSALAVIVGPGSFTGLRVGLATAQGMAAGLGVPAFPADATRAWALALRGADRPVAVTLDARRGEVYTALWSVPAGAAPRALLPLRLQRPEAWAEALAGREVVFVGDGAALHCDALAGLGAFVDPGGPGLGPLAVELALAIAAEPGLLPDPLRPVYLRDHDAARPSG